MQLIDLQQVTRRKKNPFARACGWPMQSGELTWGGKSHDVLSVSELQ